MEYISNQTEFLPLQFSTFWAHKLFFTLTNNKKNYPLHYTTICYTILQKLSIVPKWTFWEQIKPMETTIFDNPISLKRREEIKRGVGERDKCLTEKCLGLSPRGHKLAGRVEQTGGYIFSLKGKKENSSLSNQVHNLPFFLLYLLDLKHGNIYTRVRWQYIMCSFLSAMGLVVLKMLDFLLFSQTAEPKVDGQLHMQCSHLHFVLRLPCPKTVLQTTYLF